MMRSEFMAMLHTFMMNNRGQRKGQAAFNLLHSYFPVEADRVRGSAIDPFYDDSRLTPFLSHFGIEQIMWHHMIVAFYYQSKAAFFFLLSLPTLAFILFS